MRKKCALGLLCVVVWLCVELVVAGGDGPPVAPPTIAPTNTASVPPPIQPEPISLTPTPTREPPPDPPFDHKGEGEQVGMPGSGFPKQPAKADAKPEIHVVIGMYDSMLKTVQQKRYWPVSDLRYDGCVMLHNTDWICP